MRSLIEKRTNREDYSSLDGGLTQAALGFVLKTKGTVMNRMGIDTSVLRQTY